jgi:hypothetical protein
MTRNQTIVSCFPQLWRPDVIELYHYVQVRAGTTAAVDSPSPRHEERKMPICHIKAPPGINQAAKVRMMEKVAAAIDEGYNHIGVTIITLEEDKLDNVMVAGRIASSDPKYEDFRKAQAAGRS